MVALSFLDRLPNNFKLLMVHRHDAFVLNHNRHNWRDKLGDDNFFIQDDQVGGEFGFLRQKAHLQMRLTLNIFVVPRRQFDDALFLHPHTNFAKQVGVGVNLLHAVSNPR